MSSIVIFHKFHIFIFYEFPGILFLERTLSHKIHKIHTHYYYNSKLIWRTVSRRVDEALHVPSDHPNLYQVVRKRTVQKMYHLYVYNKKEGTMRYKPIGISHSYHLEQYASFWRVVVWYYSFYSNFNRTHCKQIVVTLALHYLHMSYVMRLPTMLFMRPAKAQTSLRIRAV